MKNTSIEVTTRWNKEHYSTLDVEVPKDIAFHFKSKCEDEGVSYNSIIWKGIEKFLEETK